jgi:hypothetical protein
MKVPDTKGNSRMRRLSRLFAVALVATGLTLACDAATGNASPAAPAADVPPPIIEDFAYPGAAEILRDRGILLRTGDGHILLVDCPSNIDYLIVLQSRENGRVCFDSTGYHGSLTMEIPSVYLAKGSQFPYAKLTTTTAAGVRNAMWLDPNGWTSVGEGTGGDPTTVLQIDTAPYRD